MLINLTNHSHVLWNETQLNLANKFYQEVVSIPFPHIEPEFSSEDLNEIVQYYLTKILDLAKEFDAKGFTVHIQGESVFVYKLVSLLKQQGIVCIASTTKRDVIDLGTEKVVKFKFIRFREY
jgi:hypothetical protein